MLLFFPKRSFSAHTIDSLILSESTPEKHGSGMMLLLVILMMILLRKVLLRNVNYGRSGNRETQVRRSILKQRKKL